MLHPVERRLPRRQRDHDAAHPFDQGSSPAYAPDGTLYVAYEGNQASDVTKDQTETSVLFELISARYERRSMLITANQPFGDWGKVFPDPAMTLAAVNRLVHRATIFELNVQSYRRRTAMERKQQGPGRPANHATPKNVRVPPPHDNQPVA